MDARIPEKWLSDRRLLRLSDRAHRLFITALVWSVSNRTDGVLYADDLPLMPRVDDSGSAELEKAGLWKHERDHWLIVDFADTQTSAEELASLDARRRSDRDRKARLRAKQKVSRDSPVDSHGDGHVDAYRQGKARQGQARTGTNEEHEEDWPEIAELGQSSGDFYDQLP